ncbi:MAG: tRNA (adenosine(37)-N6)-threonylcarbamoyltransferase complex transferase subunit TsaD [Candidatus Jordarchaeales archaeon]
MATAARALALALNVPLVGVNHCLAHIEIGRLTENVEDPLTLYVSGGNTLVAAYEKGRYRVFGETLDLAIGNMLDMLARALGLKHPGGPKVEELARKGSTFIPLPYVVKGMDLSYSGVYTAAVGKIGSCKVEDLCYSVQEVCFSMLAEVTERALAHTRKGDVLLTGGVGRNRRLQEMIRVIAEEHGASFHVVPQQLAGDNGAMIAWTGILEYVSGRILRVEESYVKPRWRLDEVQVSWVESER